MLAVLSQVARGKGEVVNAVPALHREVVNAVPALHRLVQLTCA